MKLDATAIAHVAREAGFVPPDVATAVAVALAGSGGITQYQHVILPPGSGDWRGLFTVNVDEHPAYRYVDLFEPYQAARAAKALTVEYDGWDWSSTYRVGAWRQHHDHASVESTRVHVAQHAVTPMTVHASGAHLRDTLDNARALRHTVANLPNRGTAAWPITTP